MAFPLSADHCTTLDGKTADQESMKCPADAPSAGPSLARRAASCCPDDAGAPLSAAACPCGAGAASDRGSPAAAAVPALASPGPAALIGLPLYGLMLLR